MGVLYKDSWHSKHAGQTVDDAIDGYRQIQDTINEIYGDISALKLALDECNASLKVNMIKLVALLLLANLLMLLILSEKEVWIYHY